MRESAAKYFCCSCKKEVTDKDSACPHCDADLKKIGRNALEINVWNGVKVTEPLRRIRQKTQGRPGYAVDAKYRDKTSGETKRPTKEQLVIDTRNNKKTVKIHYVEEWDGKQWIVVHDEHKEFKAKRR